MKETDCRKCCVCAFKEDLCNGDFCEKYYREGNTEDFEKLLPHWIPCSERLPDNDESVLISNSHGVTKAWWNGRCWTSIGVKKYKTVTAWMPLPEPYKEGEQK